MKQSLVSMTFGLVVTFMITLGGTCNAEENLYHIGYQQWSFLGNYDGVKGYIDVNDWSCENNAQILNSNCNLLLVYEEKNKQKLIYKEYVNLVVSLQNSHNIKYKIKSTWIKTEKGEETINDYPNVFAVPVPSSIKESLYLDALIFMMANSQL